MSVYDLAKRLLPGRVRNAIRSPLQRLVLGSSTDDGSPQQLGRRVEALEKALFDLMPEELPIGADVEAAVANFRKEHGIDQAIELSVSRRDLMFWYIRQLAGSLPEAYNHYLATGLEAHRLVADAVETRLGGFGKVETLLDFASGYGRLTRFLVHALAPERIWVADIKPAAVAFQQRVFGVNGLVAPALPESCGLHQRFDVIFVGSLFTHLAQPGFDGWLARLLELLRPGGLLIFTTVAASEADPEGFAFEATSEDSPFSFVDDSLASNESYGTTRASEAYVVARLGALGIPPQGVERRPAALWGNQDVYLVQR